MINVLEIPSGEFHLETWRYEKPVGIALKRDADD
jgi:hypothetical protein